MHLFTINCIVANSLRKGIKLFTLMIVGINRIIQHQLIFCFHENVKKVTLHDTLQGKVSQVQ